MWSCSEGTAVGLELEAPLDTKVGLVPHPTEGHPESLSLQLLQDPSQFRTGAGRVLLYQKPVHQVSVLLIHLDGRLTHLMEVLVLPEPTQQTAQLANKKYILTGILV